MWAGRTPSMGVTVDFLEKLEALELRDSERGSRGGSPRSFRSTDSAPEASCSASGGAAAPT